MPSCAARVTAGEPFSLRVASDTALCEAAYAEDLVLLCSAFVVGQAWNWSLGLRARLGRSSTVCVGRLAMRQRMPRGVAPRHFPCQRMWRRS